jgi:hypothetical protein
LSTYDPVLHLRTNPADRWIFRWGFEFVGNKSPRIGGWFPASRFEDMASAVNKEGLLRAYVEGKHWTRRETKVFAECSGQDFLNFQHMALYIQLGKEKRAINHVFGMALHTRYEIIKCLDNGSVERERRELKSDYIYPEWTRH